MGRCPAFIPRIPIAFVWTSVLSWFPGEGFAAFVKDLGVFADGPGEHPFPTAEPGFLGLEGFVLWESGGYEEPRQVDGQVFFRYQPHWLLLHA